MQYQVSNYHDDNIDYDVSLVELTDTDKKVGRGEYVRILMINNDKHGALWSGRIECVYDIDESLPLLSVFGDFAERNSFGEEDKVHQVSPSTFSLPKNLKYVYNGEDITAQIAKRPTELGMKDGDKIFVLGIPPPIDVNFIDEYGKITTLQTRPGVRLSCLFEDYGVQSKMPFLISINMYEFRYNGELLYDELSLRHISNGSSNITVYVRLLFTVERVGQVQQFILKNCKGIVRHTPPRKLIGQQVQGVTLGKIVEYIHSGDNISWTAEFDIGFKHKKNLSESMFVLVLESYYKTGGVMFDLLEYVQNKLAEYGGRMQAIIETNWTAIDARNMELLKVMNLETEMEKISLIVDWLRKMIIQSELSQMEDSLKELLSTMQKFKVEAKSVTSKVNKSILHLLQPGDFVYILSQNVPTWERGIIIALSEHEDIDGYGPRQVYSVVFINGERSDVEDYQVILEKEYFTSKDTKESDWKGVHRVFDKNSSDPWAREVGWYTADIEGIEEPFVHLSDALRAYDISQARTKRGDLKQSDLNHPKDWAQLKDHVKKDLNMELRLMLSHERISDSSMKVMCRALIHLLQADRIQFGFVWKEALGNFASRYRLYLFAIMNQSAAVSVCQSTQLYLHLSVIYSSYFVMADVSGN